MEQQVLSVGQEIMSVTIYLHAATISSRSLPYDAAVTKFHEMSQCPLHILLLECLLKLALQRRPKQNILFASAGSSSKIFRRGRFQKLDISATFNAMTGALCTLLPADRKLLFSVPMLLYC